jgi:hypothetical protein
MKFETQRGVALHEESDSDNEMQSQSFVAVAAPRMRGGDSWSTDLNADWRFV